MAHGTLTGLVAGLLLSPVTGSVSTARRARMFHPRGICCAAEAEPASPGMPPAAREVADRLAGPVIVRWSSALWKRGEWQDVFGCALRFAEAPLGVEPTPADQDLLLATIQRPWTMPFSPLTTVRRDFLCNGYYGVSPFEVAPLGRVEWRLTAADGRRAPGTGHTRRERLLRAIDAHTELVLSCAPYPGPLRRPRQHAFEPIVTLRLLHLLDLDDDRLRFDPFRRGRGIEPVGFVHHMRRAAYWASQAARPGGRGLVRSAP